MISNITIEIFVKKNLFSSIYMSEGNIENSKNTKLMNEFKLLIQKINMAKLLKDNKLKKALNKELNKKKSEMKKLQKELFMESLLTM